METPNTHQQTLAEFFTPSKSMRIWRIILAAIVSLMIVGAAYEFSKPAPEPVQMTHASDSDTHSYLDVMLLSDWIYKVSGDENYTLYAAMDPDGTWFIVSLDDDVAAPLQPYMDAYDAYFTENYQDYTYPEPTRIYGMPTYINSDDASAIANYFEMENSESAEFFGANYLNEGADNTRAGGMLFLIGAIVMSFFLLAIVIQIATIQRNYKKSDARLYSLGLMDEAENQFLNASTLKNDKMKLALSEDYAFVGANGHIVPYTDIAWVYKRTQRSYGVTVATQLMAGLYSGKQIFLAQRHANDEFVTETAKKILTKNPNCLIGYSFDLAKQYRQRVKEYKLNNPK